MTSGMPAQAPQPMTDPRRAVLILGAAKSGTTALFYAVRKALAVAHGGSASGLFEPRRAGEIEEYLDSTTDRVPVVKMLLGPLFRDGGSFLEKFDRKIVIYRDPRDNVISRICFMLKKMIAPRDKEKIEEVLELFRKKERAPESMSVVEMLRQMERITGRSNLRESVRTNSLLPAKIKREHGETYFMMPYDDLVLDRFDRLNEYLGVSVSSDYEVAERHSFVVRSKSSGAWKDWFLEEDVQFFARDVADDFAVLGFDAEAVPNREKKIEARTSSEYVASQFQHLRDKRLRAKKAKENLAPAAAVAPPKRPSVATDARRERRLRRREAAAGREPKAPTQQPGLEAARLGQQADRASPAGENKRDRRRRRKGGKTDLPQTSAQASPSQAKIERRRARRARSLAGSRSTNGA